MKTTEALKVLTATLPPLRELQKHYHEKANRPLIKDRALRQKYLRMSKAHEAEADAIEHLTNEHRILRTEAETLRGMLSFTLEALTTGREFSKQDAKQIRSQLKVTRLILKATQP